MEEVEKQVAQVLEDHASWMFHPVFVTTENDPVPGAEIICICGKTVATTVDATTEDWIYSVWSKHVDPLVDRVYDDYYDEDNEDDDLLEGVVLIGED